MLVKNATDHVLILPTDATGRSQVRLLMGWSEVANTSWQGAVPHIGNLLEDGVIEHLEPVKEKDASGKKDVERPRELKDLSQKEATKLLKECYDTKCLQGWLEGADGYSHEVRESVRVVIQDRIKMLTERSPSSAAAEDKKAAAAAQRH